MKDYARFMWTMLVIIFSIAFLGFAANALGFVSFAFFAPKVEQVRYNTFKESQSYNDGMLRDLQELKMQYIGANPEQKQALREITIHRFSVYQIDRLPPDLQSFYMSLTSQGTLQ